jgi:orotate phosphoribosyltransferase
MQEVTSSSLDEIRQTIRGFDLVKRRSVLQKAGSVLPVHIDVKGAFGDPQRLLIIAAGLNALLDARATCVAACGYGGIPLAVAIALRRNCPLALVRETAKPYGTGTIIEGYQPTPNDNVAVIDDKIVSGRTLANAIATLRATDATIIGTYVVVYARHKKIDPSVNCLFALDDLTP